MGLEKELEQIRGKSRTVMPDMKNLRGQLHLQVKYTKILQPYLGANGAPLMEGLLGHSHPLTVLWLTFPFREQAS